MRTEVANVVFDIGGVLLDWNPRHLYRRLIADEDEMERFLAEVCTVPWNLTLDEGRSIDDACDELAAEHPENADLIHAWKDQEDMVGGEIPGTADLVRRLKAAGTDLYLLTNMPAQFFRLRQERFGVLREFRGAVVSGEEQLLKPSAEIFAVLTDRFGLDPAETLFVDDVAENVEGARAAGFHGHRFVDAPTLEEELVALGLL